VELTEGQHLSGVHGRGNVLTPGNWNGRWDIFIKTNPRATTLEIYQFAGKLTDEHNLNSRPIVPYR
jgi:hypothetical protein